MSPYGFTGRQWVKDVIAWSLGIQTMHDKSTNICAVIYMSDLAEIPLNQIPQTFALLMAIDCHVNTTHGL